MAKLVVSTEYGLRSTIDAVMFVGEGYVGEISFAWLSSIQTLKEQHRGRTKEPFLEPSLVKSLPLAHLPGTECRGSLHYKGHHIFLLNCAETLIATHAFI